MLSYSWSGRSRGSDILLCAESSGPIQKLKIDQWINDEYATRESKYEGLEAVEWYGAYGPMQCECRRESGWARRRFYRRLSGAKKSSRDHDLRR